jgi:hypothetical protein
MRLTYFLKESKGVLGVFGVLLIINSYIYGYLSGGAKNPPKPVIFESKTLKIESQSIEQKPPSDIVASKNGTRFYYTWCGGSNRIKPENRRYFDTLDEALKEGYKPASNCPGL